MTTQQRLPEWIWVYEDQLPSDMDGKVYDFLYPLSAIVDGVRMFPWPLQMIGKIGK